MNRQLASSILRCLRFDSQVEPWARDLARFSERDWERTAHWLDWSGLPLYLFAQLEQASLTSCLPCAVAERLQRSLADNRERNAGMLAETARISAAFESRGIHFAVMKGASLVPVFCPDAGLRQQSDLDFLVDPATAAGVDAALHELGYSLVKSFADTRTYTRKPGFVPRHEDIYRPGTHQAVEIHFVLWEFLQSMGAEPPADVLALTRQYVVNGVPLRSVSPIDQFLHQAVHVVEHVVRYWVRTCWVYELARGIRYYGDKPRFWDDLRDRCREQPNYASIACASITLAQQTFGVPMGAGEGFLRESLSPRIALWIERYGHELVMTEAPGTKLTMLLHREWVVPSEWDAYEREKLFPFHQAAAPYLLGHDRRRSFADGLRYWAYAARRGVFHVMEGARYLRERRAWDRLHSTAATAVLPQSSRGESRA